MVIRPLVDFQDSLRQPLHENVPFGKKQAQNYVQRKGLLSVLKRNVNIAV